MSILVSTILLSVGLLYGPADTPLRAMVVGACAGSVACCLALFTFPGWEVFCAALAFCVAGGLHQDQPGPDWPTQAALALLTLASWAAASVLTRFCLESFGTEFEPCQPPWEGWEEAPAAALVRGCAFTLAVAGTMIPILVWNFSSVSAIGFPVAALVCAWGCAAFPGVGLGWPLVGCLAAPLGAYFVGMRALPQKTNELFSCPVYPHDLAILPPPDAWLVHGVLVAGAVCGYWLTVWLQSLYYQAEDASPA